MPARLFIKVKFRLLPKGNLRLVVYQEGQYPPAWVDWVCQYQVEVEAYPLERLSRLGLACLLECLSGLASE